MTSITTDTNETPAAEASNPETTPKKATKNANPVKKATKKEKSAKKRMPAKKRAKTAAAAKAPEQSNKKADVIAMMKRSKGATLDELMRATGWQKHTVRGFVSILGSKGGHTIESSKNADGERTYKITK